MSFCYLLYRLPCNLFVKSQSSKARRVWYQNYKHLIQTCSSPPLKSMYIFGMDCSGPGSPLCLHHLASTLTEQQKGPIRDLVLSLRLVLSRKSFMFRTKDDPWIPKKTDGEFILPVVILPAFLCLLSKFTLGWHCKSVPARSFSQKQSHWLPQKHFCGPPLSCPSRRITVGPQDLWFFFFFLQLALPTLLSTLYAVLQLRSRYVSCAFLTKSYLPKHYDFLHVWVF